MSAGEGGNHRGQEAAWNDGQVREVHEILVTKADGRGWGKRGGGGEKREVCSVPIKTRE